jgi:glycosyltransferase involved in cell wall biosynthesis
MRRVLLMDLSATGHHPRYLKWIIDSEVCRESEIYLAGRRELLDHAELRDVGERINPVEVAVSQKEESILGRTSSPAELVQRQFTVRSILRRVYAEVIRDIKIDLVFLAFADDCLDSIGLVGSPFSGSQWAGIVFRPMFHFQEVGVQAPAPRFSAARKSVFQRALREKNLAGLFTIDPTLTDYATRNFNSNECARLRFLPDPAIDHKLVLAEVARRELGIPSDARTVLAYGALSERKGIRTLIDSAANASCAARVHVILAGEQSAELRTFLQGETATALRCQNRLHVLEGYQSDREEARLLAASDCMWVGYSGFYVMSGVLLLAARHGIPCIVSEPGIAGYLMRKHGFGLLVNCENCHSVVEALNDLATGREAMEAAGKRGKAAFQRHSVSEFQKEIGLVIEGVGAR